MADTAIPASDYEVNLTPRFETPVQNEPVPMPAPNGSTDATRTTFRRRFTDGDPFLNFIDLQPCLNQLANWAALLPPEDTQRQAILVVLRLEYARLRKYGMTTPPLPYREALLAALEGGRKRPSPGWARRPAKASATHPPCDTTWPGGRIDGDVDFSRQLQRLDACLAAERVRSNQSSLAG